MKWIKLIAVIIILGGVFYLGTRVNKSTENIITIGSNRIFRQFWRDFNKPIFPYLILLPSEDDGIDSFWVHDTTQAKNIPVSCCSIYIPVPVFVNDKNESYGGYAKLYGRIASLDSSIVIIPEKRIVVKETVKGWFNYYAGLNVWIDQGKHLSADIEGGIGYKRRFMLKAKVEADHEYNVKLKAGISIGI